MVRQCHSSWGLRGGDSTVREVLSRASVTCLLGVLRSSSQLSRASVTCLLDVELGVEEFFFGVKGVGDVLAELDVELGVMFSLVSRASVRCLLSWTWSWVLCFLWCQGRR